MVVGRSVVGGWSSVIRNKIRGHDGLAVERGRAALPGRRMPGRPGAAANRSTGNGGSSQHHRYLRSGHSARPGQQEPGGSRRPACRHDGDPADLQPARRPRTPDLRRARAVREGLDPGRRPGDGRHLQPGRDDQRPSAASGVVQRLDDSRAGDVDGHLQQGAEGVSRELSGRGAGCASPRGAARENRARGNAHLRLSDRRREGRRAPARVGRGQRAAVGARTLNPLAMQHRFLCLLVVAIFTSVASAPASGQARAGAPPSYRPPLTADGKADLQGVWQVLNTAAWDIQDHAARLGVPAGQGVVEGNDIPYQAWAAAKKKENFEKRLTDDPVAKCYLPGVPRITYMPHPFQIFQTAGVTLILYEYDHAVRTIYTDRPNLPGPIDFWLGVSRGHWD